MRLYLGLLTATLLEAAVWHISLVVALLIGVLTFKSGMPVLVTALGGIAAFLAMMWFIYGLLNFGRQLDNSIQKLRRPNESQPRKRSTKIIVASLTTVVVLSAVVLLYVPLAVGVSLWLKRDLLETLLLIFFAESFIGFPVFFILAASAYSRAKAYFFQSDDGPPKSPDLDDRIRATLEKDLNTPS